MKYHYICKNCNLLDYENSNLDFKVMVGRMTEFDNNGEIILDKSPLVWEIQHSMSESPEVKCPICNTVCGRTVQQISAFYTRGNGYLDKKGCKRDMNVHTLEHNDPYAPYRTSGEVDYLQDKLRKEGKFNPKPQYFYKK